MVCIGLVLRLSTFFLPLCWEAWNPLQSCEPRDVVQAQCWQGSAVFISYVEHFAEETLQ